MDQATDFESFRKACTFSHIPGENMVWIDRDGHIGWQAVGIAPIRHNFSGMVAVPGDGRYEWSGYLPIQARPHLEDPSSGFWVTANNQVTAADYPFPEALGYTWSAPYRSHRIAEVLNQGKKLTMDDFIALQTDYTSLPARSLIPMLSTIQWDRKLESDAVSWLKAWDHQLSPDSRAAAVFVAWERELIKQMKSVAIPANVRNIYGYLDMRLIIRWLTYPPAFFGHDLASGRDHLIKLSFQQALQNLEIQLGKDASVWRYGSEKYKHIFLKHTLSDVVNPVLAKQLNLGPLPRGGDGFTVNNAGNGDNQTSGPSFKLLVDAQDWDLSLAMNNPGQSGDPASPFYSNLFLMWQQNRYFPMYYSKTRVMENSRFRMVLSPE